MCKSAVIVGNELSDYSFGEKHPLNSKRLEAFWSILNHSESIHTGNLKILSPILADENTVASFHEKNTSIL